MGSKVVNLFAAVLLVIQSGLAFGQSGKVQEDAVLDQIKGRIMVNQGTSYKPGREGMKLKEGDQVMAVGEGSEGLVVYPDGCDYRVTVREIHKVTDSSPCVLAANSGGAGTPPPPGATPSKAPLIIGGFAAACVVGCFDHGSISPEQ